jgi:hypothetical protein
MTYIGGEDQSMYLFDDNNNHHQHHDMYVNPSLHNTFALTIYDNMKIVRWRYKGSLPYSGDAYDR